jgi:pyridoxine 4-dehydrogenase
VGYCDEEGLGFLAYSPVGGGRLNKKLPGIPALQAIAAARGVSPHSIVLAWVLARGRSVIVIPAARREAHVLDSQAAARITLDDAELMEIDRAEFSIA